MAKGVQVHHRPSAQGLHRHGRQDGVRCGRVDPRAVLGMQRRRRTAAAMPAAARAASASAAFSAASRAACSARSGVPPAAGSLSVLLGGAPIRLGEQRRLFAHDLRHPDGYHRLFSEHAFRKASRAAASCRRRPAAGRSRRWGLAAPWRTSIRTRWSSRRICRISCRAVALGLRLRRRRRAHLQSRPDCHAGRQCDGALVHE